MIRQSIKIQLMTIMGKKTYMFVVLLIFGLIFTNFLINVFTFRGTDVVDMYDPMKLLTISHWSSLSSLFTQFYPLLVVLASGFSLFHDKETEMITYWFARVGRRAYYIGNIVASFIAAFLLFTVPFLIEVVLNCISFPLNANGDPSGISSYLGDIGQVTRNYLLFPLYYQNTFLYIVVSIFMLGLVSGILAVFTNAFAFFPLKFKILLFLPVYVLLFCLSNVGKLINLDIYTNYSYYISAYDSSFKSGIAFAWLLILVSLFSLLIYYKKGKGDYFK